MLLWSIYGDISLNYYKTILIILRAVLESKAGQQNTFKTNAKFEMSEGIDNQVYQIDCVYGIPEDGRSSIKIKTREMEELYLDPEDSNFRFLEDLPNDRIGIFAA